MNVTFVVLISKKDLIIFEKMNAKRQQNEAIGSPQYVWLLKA